MMAAGSRTASLVLMVGGLLGGAVTGLSAAAVGRLLGEQVATGWGDVVGVLLGMLIGYPIGVAIGVILVGRRLGRRGSHWPAPLGSLTGAGLVLALAEPLRLNQSPLLLQGLFILLPPLLATLALEWRRRQAG